jgi:ABC-2 type transport system permease protein
MASVVERLQLADAAPRGTARGASWQAALTLAQREIVRFLRQRHRIFGALGQPILFWLFLGMGLRGSFRPETPAGAVPYEEFFFPGVLAMIVLFTAIFATVSIIEDRREGFLQGVLVAPVGRFWVVLGKVLGGTALAMLQAVLFLALAPLAGVRLTLAGAAASIALLVVLGVALTSLGLILAWRSDSVQGFHAVMSMFLFPMWFLSGSVFPLEGAPAWLAWIVRANPLTYGVAALRRLLYLGDPRPPIPESTAGLLLSVGVTVAFAVAALLSAARTAEET